LLLAVSGADGSTLQTPKRGGTVVIAGSVPACLNFLLEGCGSPISVFPGAFEVGPDAAYRPDLVSGVDVTKDPFTLTYYIRPKARWSDGTPVTASDFRFMSRVPVPPHATEVLKRGVRKIRRVAALDAKTFRVWFRAPFAPWRVLYPVVLPRHALVGEDLSRIWQDRIDNPKTGDPIGSGPFLVERLDPGRELILVRNPRYWGPHTAHLDRIVFRSVEGDLVAALRSGLVDVVFPSTGQEIGALQREPGIRLLTGATSRWEHFEIRIGAPGHPALESRLVRRALAYGVDREELAQIYGPTQRPLDSAVFLAQSRFYRPHWNVYRYRPAEARRLLGQAGCRRGADGIYACGGKRLSLRFVTTAGWPTRELTLQLVQAQLRRAGVAVVPVYAPSAAFLGKDKHSILGRGAFDVALFAWVGGAGEISDIDIIGCDRPGNFTGYCSTRVTRDLIESDRLLAAQRRADLLNRVDEQLTSDVPVLPLFQMPYPLALRTTVRGVARNPSPQWLYWNVEDWWLER
jgi:peptide/nickel transport system substrate-binding protein